MVQSDTDSGTLCGDDSPAQHQPDWSALSMDPSQDQVVSFCKAWSRHVPLDGNGEEDPTVSDALRRFLTESESVP